MTRHIFAFCSLLLIAACSNAQNSSPIRPIIPANTVLWYDTPAKSGMNEALPVGNGRIGALVYGGERERLVLNESSLWTGDENPSGDYDSMGAYQMLGELLLTPDAAPAAFTNISVRSGHKAYFPTQEVNYATDGDTKTKWCVEHGGKPVVWQVEMPAGAPAATWYSFTVADDVPARDPGTWQLAGSMNGEAWTPLDFKQNQPSLAKRGDTERFTFANTTAYRFYQFTFQPNLALQHFQVAEIGLQGLSPLPAGNKAEARTPLDFHRELNIAGAIATTSYTQNGVHFRRETFASRPADVIVVRWSADKAGALNGTLQLKGAHGEAVSVDGNTLSFCGKFPNGLQYTTRTCVLNKGGAISITDGKVQLKGCTEALILVGAGTNYIYNYNRHYLGSLPSSRVAGQLAAAEKQSFVRLRRDHEVQFQKVFGRASLDLGTTPAARTTLSTDRRKLQAIQGDDPDLEELMFQYGRYLLISCSRPGALPANLQGLWNDSNDPAWHSDYHTNINIQMNYWPAEVTNLSEYHTPLFDLAKSQLPAWRKATAASKEWMTTAGTRTTRGFAVRTSHNITGGMGWKWDKTSNAWYCQHFWEHYAFTGDKKYLRDIAYPIMKETCQFWEDHLKTLADGRLVVPNGWSPEHGPDEDGVSYNQQIVWDLFNNTTQAAKDLGVDANYALKVATMRDKLVGPRIGRWGQLQEWMEDKDDPDDHNRHTSNLFAVFPGHQVSFAQTPDLAKGAKVSLDARGISPNSDVREWSFAWRTALYARLHDGERAHAMVLQLFSERNTCPNLFGLHPPMQIDGNFGVTAGIAEMLLQSHEGEINLLPALPLAWQNGSFKGLRARGGVTVDATWRKGHLTSVTFISNKTGMINVRSGNECVSVRFQAGRRTRLGAHLIR